jgi:hypothetical protein
MRARVLSSILVSALLCCAGGCYATSVVGNSGASPQKRGKHNDSSGVAGQPAPSAPKVPSVISSRLGEQIGLNNPYLGDVDGDGLDDFLVFALVYTSLQDPNAGTDTLAYLYYGRRDFPAQLSTADADAVFHTDAFLSGPLGDVDGDGLADFVLGRGSSAEIVFGSRQRLHGVYNPFSAGPRWEPIPLPSPFPPESTQMSMRGLGDIDGDGFADLAVTGSKLLPPEEAAKVQAAYGLSTQSYIVPGHAGKWPSLTWDLSQAVAELGYETVPYDPIENVNGFIRPLTPVGLGDVDGDGVDDWGAPTVDGVLLFYGGRELRGRIEAEQADAHLLADVGWMAALGDADGDGAADLVAIASDARIAIYYGRRWSGDVRLQPDLMLAVENLDPASFSVASGDIDGDAYPEIVLRAASIGDTFDGDTSMPATGRLYVLRGTGTRLTGQRALDARDELTRGLSAWTPQFGHLDVGAAFGMNGDVDGDGSKDILTSALAPNAGSGLVPAVYLVPGTPKTPD